MSWPSAWERSARWTHTLSESSNRNACFFTFRRCLIPFRLKFALADFAAAAGPCADNDVARNNKAEIAVRVFMISSP